MHVRPLFHLQAQGLLRLVAIILSSTPTATHSVSLGVTTQRLTSQLMLCLCAGSSLSSQPDIPFIQDLNLTTSNTYSCEIQIRHTRKVLNIWMDIHGPLPEHKIVLGQVSKDGLCTHVGESNWCILLLNEQQTGLALFRDTEKFSWCLMHFRINIAWLKGQTMKRKTKDSPWPPPSVCRSSEELLFGCVYGGCGCVLKIIRLICFVCRVALNIPLT